MRGYKRYLRSHERIERMRLIVPQRMIETFWIKARNEGWDILSNNPAPVPDRDFRVDPSRRVIIMERKIK